MRRFCCLFVEKLDSLVLKILSEHKEKVLILLFRLSSYVRCDVSYDVWGRSGIRILTNKLWNQNPFDMTLTSTAMGQTVIKTLLVIRIQDPVLFDLGIRDGQKIRIRYPDPDPG